MTENKLFDKRGIPIEVGDVVKVYHFTAALRRKKNYMYKQCVEVGMWEAKEHAPEYHWLKFSHLDMSDDYYHEERNNMIRTDFEIVQSVKCDHEERLRK